jgi:hypothetical protein
MMGAFYQLIRSFAMRPRKVFLLDAAGALLTALLLLCIVAPFEGFFKMPAAIVYKLSALAGFFWLYSIGCCWFNPTRWKPYLTAIIIANSLYCCLTLALVLYHWQRLSGWGVAYFLVEAVVLCLLVAFEIKVLRYAE